MTDLRKAPAQQGKASLRLAAEQALEALESLDCGDTYKTHNAASALRQALSTLEKPDTWIGLTAPEVNECYDLNPARFASYIEAKLKEKNNA
jgi:hypothetical protein